MSGGGRSQETLEDRLGPATGLPVWPSALEGSGAIERWLRAWVEEQLLAVEIEAARDAFYADTKGGISELMRVDGSLGAADMPPSIAESLRRLGRQELQRLRPLVDVRDLKGYRNAVESGRASGWWPVVYGLELRVYSIALTQGLVGYGEWALGGALSVARQRGRMAASFVTRLEEEASLRVRRGVAERLRSDFTLRVT